MSIEAQTALIKSAEHLGYGMNGVTFLQTETENGELSSAELFDAIEGLDPLCIVITDKSSEQLFAQAYHVILPKVPAMRVFGREVRLLPRLDQLVETPAGKQVAWAALKTLPRIGS